MTLLSKNARVAGLIYLVGGLVALVRLSYIPDTLIVSNNTTATVNNITTHELRFRFGIVTQLLTGALWIFVTLALYRLFKEVDKGLAVLIVILGSLVVTPRIWPCFSACQVLRLRRIEQPLATGVVVVLPSSLPERSRHPDPSAFRSSIARPTDTFVYASSDTSQCRLQDSRPGWIRCFPFL